MTQDELKAAVAREAIKHVVDDLPVGVGTGSTANFFIDELAKIKNRIVGAVPSSEKTAERLRAHGIRILELNSVNELPVYVDGADEIAPDMSLIKGGGGALLRDLDRLLAEETGLPVLVAEDPLTCVVRGCGLALERMERLGSIFTSE